MGVLLVYAITAGVIWLREIQQLEEEISSAEGAAREVIRQAGQKAVEALNEDVQSLNDEFQQLERMITI